jgi:hypothetical protein
MHRREECRGFANSGCGNKALAQRMSQLEDTPHMNIDAAEALA